jgi:2C-methyl-D-erythritol 2,4-cyclodiphosphate synthase
VNNRLNEVRRLISMLRLQMLAAENTIRTQINRDEDCTAASLRLMATRTEMLGLIGERDSLGGSEQLLNVEQRLKAEHPSKQTGQ